MNKNKYHASPLCMGKSELYLRPAAAAAAAAADPPTFSLWTAERASTSAHASTFLGWGLSLLLPAEGSPQFVGVALDRGQELAGWVCVHTPPALNPTDFRIPLVRVSSKLVVNCLGQNGKGPVSESLNHAPAPSIGSTRWSTCQLEGCPPTRP